MHLARIIPGIGGLPELRVYSCGQCGASVTEAQEPRELEPHELKPHELKPRELAGRRRATA
jgi:hypothetical protein